jgi:beta-lactamase class A
MYHCNQFIYLLQNLTEAYSAIYTRTLIAMDYAHSNYIPRQRHSPVKHTVKTIRLMSLLSIGVIVLFTGIYILTEDRQRQARLVSPISANVYQDVESINTYDPGLEEVVLDALDGSSGTYGIVIKNLRSGKQFVYNDVRVYTSASLYKLWVMATVMQQLEQGKITENQVFSSDIVKLNETFNIASESAERTEGTISLSVANAVDRMITISDNYSALLLSSRVRLANVNALLEANGMFDSKTGQPPKTTARDIALYFEKLYSNQLVSPRASDRMVEILKRQRLNDRIPKYLPKTVQVAHKTGELDQFKHDAGIVYAPFGDYIIVVLSESVSPAGAAERTAQLSKSVYEYFQKQDQNE